MSLVGAWPGILMGDIEEMEEPDVSRKATARDASQGSVKQIMAGEKTRAQEVSCTSFHDVLEYVAGQHSFSLLI